MLGRTLSTGQRTVASGTTTTRCDLDPIPCRRWLSRRLRSVAAAAWAITMSVGLWIGAPALAGGPATAALKGSIDELIKVLETPELNTPDRVEERRQKIEKIVGDRFSYEEMSKRTLPSEWKNLSETERQEFVELFQRLLSGSYASRIEGYSGEQVIYVNERREGDYAEVRTRVITGKTEIPLDYRLLNRSGDWRVYDVIVDGVSLVNNYRGQFTKILRESSYSELVKQLREKVEKNSAHPPS